MCCWLMLSVAKKPSIGGHGVLVHPQGGRHDELAQVCQVLGPNRDSVHGWQPERGPEGRLRLRAHRAARHVNPRVDFVPHLLLSIAAEGTHSPSALHWHLEHREQPVGVVQPIRVNEEPGANHDHRWFGKRTVRCAERGEDRAWIPGRPSPLSTEADCLHLCENCTRLLKKFKRFKRIAPPQRHLRVVQQDGCRLHTEIVHSRRDRVSKELGRQVVDRFPVLVGEEPDFGRDVELGQQVVCLTRQGPVRCEPEVVEARVDMPDICFEGSYQEVALVTRPV